MRKLFIFKKIKLKNIIFGMLLFLWGIFLCFSVYLASTKKYDSDEPFMPLGYGIAVVLSGSMEPELSIGDLIIIKKTDDLNLNQVVVYQDDSKLVVHRIVEIKENEVVTKGDANNIVDNTISKTDIRGEVILAIPYLGSFLKFINTPFGTVFLLIISCTIVWRIDYIKRKKTTVKE